MLRKQELDENFKIEEQKIKLEVQQEGKQQDLEMEKNTEEINKIKKRNELRVKENNQTLAFAQKEFDLQALKMADDGYVKSMRQDLIKSVFKGLNY